MYLHGSSFVCTGVGIMPLLLGENIVRFQDMNQLLNYEAFKSLFDHAIGIEFDVSKSSTYRSIIFS